jgi:hypothetical protein
VETEILVRRQVTAERLKILDVAVEFELEQPFNVAPLVLEDDVAGARDLQQVVFEDLRNFLLPLGRQFCNAKIWIQSHRSGCGRRALFTFQVGENGFRV